MQERTLIETILFFAVNAISENGEPLFADLAVTSAPHKKELLKQFQRMEYPAGRIVLTSRKNANKNETAFSIVVGTRSHADGTAERTRINQVLDKVMVALHQVALPGGYIPRLVDETILAADERSIIAEQRFVIQHESHGVSPLFGGENITGTDASVSVTVGPPESDTQTFCFPGIDGIYSLHLGKRGRRITWNAILRAASDSSLNTIEAGLDALVHSAPQTMTDPYGRQYNDCVLESVRRIGTRNKRFEGAGVEQEMELTFLWTTG